MLTRFKRNGIPCLFRLQQRPKRQRRGAIPAQPNPSTSLHPVTLRPVRGATPPTHSLPIPSHRFSDIFAFMIHRNLAASSAPVTRNRLNRLIDRALPGQIADSFETLPGGMRNLNLLIRFGPSHPAVVLRLYRPPAAKKLPFSAPPPRPSQFPNSSLPTKPATKTSVPGSFTDMPRE